MDFITAPLIVGIITLGIYKLFELFACRRERITLIEKLGEKMSQTDLELNGKICLPGKGRFDFPELLKRLDGAGFSGPLLIEVYKDDYCKEGELKASLDYLDELLYKYSFADRE